MTELNLNQEKIFLDVISHEYHNKIKTVVLFEADFKRNYLHIDDAADGFRFAIKNPKLAGNCYNLGYSEANLSKRELCEEIKK